MDKERSSKVTFDCDGLIRFFLHVSPFCFAHQLPGVLPKRNESVTEADECLLEDLLVHCQVDLNILQLSHHFANHLQDVALIHI